MQGMHTGKPACRAISQESQDMVNQISDITVSNVWGPAQTKGLSHEWYFYSFMDIKSRYSVIYFGSAKDKALGHFELYKAFYH